MHIISQKALKRFWMTHSEYDRDAWKAECECE